MKRQTKSASRRQSKHTKRKTSKYTYKKKSPWYIRILPGVFVLTFALVGAHSLFFSSAATNPNSVVPAAPTGPAAPSGGWSVEYADAFGSCLTDTATQCSSGYARQDNTLEGINQANGFGNSNEVGVAALVPGEVNITSQGLVQRCDTAPALGDPYSCGSTRGLSSRGFATHPFNWNFGANRHFVIQYAWQMPDNSTHQDDPAVWETGVNWAWEIDNPECWGYGFGADNPANHGWTGKSCGLIAVPKDTGGGTGNLQVTIGSTAGVPADPSTALHTYTLDLNDNASGTLAATAYIDGTRIGSNSYGTFSSSQGKFILANDMRKNKACGCNIGLPGGSNTEIIRYVAVYEPTSANHAGTNGPIIVAGTGVGGGGGGSGGSTPPTTTPTPTTNPTPSQTPTTPTPTSTPTATPTSTPSGNSQSPSNGLGVSSRGADASSATSPLTSPLDATTLSPSAATTADSINLSAPTSETTSAATEIKLTSKDKKLSVTIPAGAVPAGDTCSLTTSSSTSLPAHKGSIYASYALTCIDSQGQPLSSFSSPANIVVSTPHPFIFENDKYYAYVNPGTGWVSHASAFNPADSTLIVKMSAPGQLIAARAASNSQSILIVPLAVAVGLIYASLLWWRRRQYMP